MKILHEELATEILGCLDSLDYTDLNGAQARRLHIFICGRKEVTPDTDASKLLCDVDIKGFRCMVTNIAAVFILDDEQLERSPHPLELFIFDFSKNAKDNPEAYEAKFKEEFPTEKLFLDKLFEYRDFLKGSTAEYFIELNEKQPL